MRNYLTLERIKRSILAKKFLTKRTVRIWSHQWRAWWRQNKCGYTDDPEQAGIFSGEEAFANTSHCGPEKEIRYELLAPNS